MHPQQSFKERAPLGRLSSGDKKLDGKTFYLDNVKKRSTALLLEAISLLGGRVESFLHKDVSFVVTGSQEGSKEECVTAQGGAKRTSEGTQHPIKHQESGCSNGKQPSRTPRTMACGSRGKALLEKAIRNNERLQVSSVLSNARSWGVKILYVDDVLVYLKQLTRESFSVKHKRTEKTSSKQSAHSVKAAPLRSPYLKIEDLSRKYKPLHMQSMTFPSLCYSGRFSPFESPPPPRFEKQTVQEDSKTRERKEKIEKSIEDQSQTLLSLNPSPWRPRKKDLSYCECCHQPFTSLEEHLQSDQHRSFVLDPSNYRAVDQLVAEMLPVFDPNPETLKSPSTPLPVHDACELEPLSDVETEHTVQALRMQDSSFNTHICNPSESRLSSGSVGPSPGVDFTIPNPVALPLQRTHLDTQPSIPNIQSHSSSPAMPVLTAEPQTQDTLNQQCEIFSPCLSDPCLLPDPYSLPPVLSPQVPYFPDITDSQIPYSEPPLLSPQKYTAEDTFRRRHTHEIETAESVSAVPLVISVAGTSALTENGSNPGLFGVSGQICSKNSFRFASTPSCRSSSLPRQSSITPNPKKRCRSASPEYSHRKRTKTASCVHNGRWSEQRLKLEKLQRDYMTNVESCFSFDKASDCVRQPCPKLNVSTPSTSCTAGMLRTEQICAFSVPAVENFNQAPNQIDFISDHPPLPLSSKGTIFDPDLHPDRSHCVVSCQCSPSHSTSICIEPALIPDLTTLSSATSNSDWDCDLVSRLDTASITPLQLTEQNCELDKELLHRPCPWMHNTSYESHLHTVLQPSTPTTSLCGEEIDASVFSRTVVQIVEVQH